MSVNTGPDLTEFFKLSKPRRKPCGIKFAAEQLKKAERDQLEAALATDKGIITGAAIRDWLARRGHQISDAAISSHRRKLCSCND